MSKHLLPNRKGATNNGLRVFSIYFMVALGSLGLSVWFLEVWKWGVKVPFKYEGDAVANLALVKNMLLSGCWLKSSMIGAPGTFELLDYPMSNSLHFVIMKVIGFFQHDPIAIVNCYYLLTFPLTTITSLLVFAHLKMEKPLAISLSIVYTFLPFHFMRGTAHLEYMYFIIPLVVLVFLWLLEEENLFLIKSETNLRPNLMNAKFWTSVLICLMASSCNFYYPFFAAFFLITIICYSAAQKKYASCLTACALIGVIFVGLLANSSPSLLYKMKHGKNDEILSQTRSFEQAEISGLKLTQLLLPFYNHRLTPLRNLGAKYDSLAPLQNENRSASLGVIGFTGFLFLLSISVLRLRVGFSKVLRHMSVLNLSGFLLATVGGVGVLFALIVSPMIRGYNRISVYLAFFGLIAVGELFKRLYKVARHEHVKIVICWFSAMGLGMVGLLDQTSGYFIPNYSGLKAQYLVEQDMVQRIERLMPPDSMIFQLPYVVFPESGPKTVRMSDYEHFKAYLHSNTIRWSYGAIKGREVDLWQRMVSGLPISDFVEQIVKHGFCGIWIDRNGYADDGQQVIKELKSLLMIEPLISTGNRFVFFPLKSFSKGQIETHSRKIPACQSYQSPMVNDNIDCYGLSVLCNVEGIRSVEERYLLISGWAFFQDKALLSEKTYLILQSLGGQTLYKFLASTNLRPDIVKAYQNPKLMRSGFLVLIDKTELVPSTYHLKLCLQGSEGNGQIITDNCIRIFPY